MTSKADLHTHTKYSGLSKVTFLNLPDSISEPEEVVRAAEVAGLRVLCVTDHNSLRGGLLASKVRSEVEVVAGEEVSTLDGEVLGLFMNEEIPKGLSAEETIDRIHAQGGLAIAPHPFSAHCSALGDKVSKLRLDGIEVLNAAHRDGYSDRIAQILCKDSEKALTGSSDAHARMMVGNAYTTFDGTTAEELRKAILSRRVGYGGRYTTLRDLIWMTTMTAVKLEGTIAKALVSDDNPEDAQYAREVYAMRRISKVVSFLGGLAFLAPPATLLAAVAGERLHKSNSKEMWDRMAAEGKV